MRSTTVSNMDKLKADTWTTSIKIVRLNKSSKKTFWSSTKIGSANTATCQAWAKVPHLNKWRHPINLQMEQTHSTIKRNATRSSATIRYIMPGIQYLVCPNQKPTQMKGLSRNLYSNKSNLKSLLKDIDKILRRIILYI